MRSKLLAVLAFAAWGIGTSILSILESASLITLKYFYIEVTLFVIMNVTLLTIYILYTEEKEKLENNLYKSVIENTKNALFYYKLKPYRAFEYISPAIYNILGYENTAFYKNPRKLLDFTNETNQKKLLDLFSEGSLTEDKLTIEMTKDDGTPIWINIDFTYLYDPNDNNQNIAIQGTLSDITNMKSIEIKQITSAKKRNLLLSYISHELRTPITSIAGYLTALNEGIMETREEKDEAMEILTAKTLTLKKLIDDLDQLSKLEAHQFTFDFISSSASDLVHFLINSNLKDIRTSNFEIKINFDEQFLSNYIIIIDKERINQVFSNLINNAIKYSTNEKFLKVDFTIDETEENLIVTIEDHGMGIKNESASHVFDQFFRTNQDEISAQNIEGRGLGLTLCKKIILAHQGDIYLKSIYGQGSIFTFIIPLYKESQNE